MARKIKKQIPPPIALSKDLSDGEFVENMHTDEIRSGFLVDTHRKRLWNVQIKILNEFDRVCKKYNLKWFAAYGTLLGAARHGGFIPWDDDVDVFMLRPDYEKFKQVAPVELAEPYYFDAWYNYRFDDEENSAPEEMNLPLIKERKKYGGSWPNMPILKIRDSSTTMIEFQNRPHVNQGIWIDVWPLDPGPVFDKPEHDNLFSLESNLLLCIISPDFLNNVISAEGDVVLNSELIKKFSKLSHREKALVFEDVLYKNFHESKYVSDMRQVLAMQKPQPYELKNFENPIYLPFEKIEIPVPSNYDEILKIDYGDWRKPVCSPTHSLLFYSANIPYQKFFENINLNFFQFKVL